jgi:hypothetical protein
LVCTLAYELSRDFGPEYAFGVNATIRVEDQRDLQTWATKLNVTPEKLLELVCRVGPYPDRVRGELKRMEIRHNRGRRLSDPPSSKSPL